MGMRSYVATPLVVAAILAGSVGCAPDQGRNPVDDLVHVVDLIPWARSVADIASAEQLSARIEELRATLPGLDIPDATKAALTARLEALKADAQAHPTEFKANAVKLGTLIEDVKAAVGE